MKPAKSFFLPAILLVALIACSNPDDDPIIDEDLLGVVWKVDSLRAPSGKIVTGPDSLIFTTQTNDTTHTLIYRKLNWKTTFITIQFNRDMAIVADICNTGYGIYEISVGGTLAIEGLGWTEMACPNWLALEDFFTDVLENVRAYVVAEGQLTLFNEDSSYVVNTSSE